MVNYTEKSENKYVAVQCRVQQSSKLLSVSRAGHIRQFISRALGLLK